VDQQRSKHQARGADYEHDAEPVKAALAAAGIDTTDFGRFVNRSAPGVIEPAHFDAEQAMPVLPGGRSPRRGNTAGRAARTTSGLPATPWPSYATSATSAQSQTSPQTPAMA
jgi:hypothetical protein